MVFIVSEFRGTLLRWYRTRVQHVAVVSINWTCAGYPVNLHFELRIDQQNHNYIVYETLSM
jgi:hypothetical protein